MDYCSMPARTVLGFLLLICFFNVGILYQCKTWCVSHHGISLAGTSNKCTVSLLRVKDKTAVPFMFQSYKTVSLKESLHCNLVDDVEM